MAPLTRDDIIEALMRVIVDAFSPASLLGYETSTHSAEFAVARKTLNTYSTRMLIDLHMMQGEEDERRSNVMHAKHGKSENWVRTYMVLTYDNADIFFTDDRLHFVFNSHIATNSLALYPTFQYEDTDEYYRKAVALTSVVVGIQYGLQENEGYYGRYNNAKPRLLSYSPDPADEDGIDRIARIANDDLVELILSRPEAAEQIAEIVVERETDDVQTITSVLEASTVKDIARGVL